MRALYEGLRPLEVEPTPFPKGLLSIADLTPYQLIGLLVTARELKEGGRAIGRPFEEKSLALVFQKPSLRTRASLSQAMQQLGGTVDYYGPDDIGLGDRESAHDIALTLDRMYDVVAARVFAHVILEQLANNAPTTTVLNALSDLEHPLQTLADLLTMWEKKGTLRGLSVAYIGDGNNNVTHSLALASGLLGIKLRVASPAGYGMNFGFADKAGQLATINGGEIIEMTDPREAVRGANVVYTDTWVSMGKDEERERRLRDFASYQVTPELMRLAKPDAIFMHCLPAHRGEEVEAAVIDGKQSAVFQQAENRLHTAKAVLATFVH